MKKANDKTNIELGVVPNHDKQNSNNQDLNELYHTIGKSTLEYVLYASELEFLTHMKELYDCFADTRSQIKENKQ